MVARGSGSNLGEACGSGVKGTGQGLREQRREGFRLTQEVVDLLDRSE